MLRKFRIDTIHPLGIVLFLICTFIVVSIAWKIVRPNKFNYGINNIEYLDYLKVSKVDIKDEDLQWWRTFIEENSYSNPIDSLSTFLSRIFSRNYSIRRELRHPHGYIQYGHSANANEIKMKFRIFLEYYDTGPKRNMITEVKVSEPPEQITAINQRCKSINENDVKFPLANSVYIWWPNEIHQHYRDKRESLDEQFKKKYPDKYINNQEYTYLQQGEKKQAYEYFWCEDIKSYLGLGLFYENPKNVYLWHMSN